ncbi:MAG: cytochrome P450 [Arenicellales bacterium]
MRKTGARGPSGETVTLLRTKRRSSPGSARPLPSLRATAPGPPRNGNLDARTDKLALGLDLQARYGDVARIESDYGESVLIARPDLVERAFHGRATERVSALRIALGNGLLGGTGDYWRQQRRLMQPKFKRHSVLGLGPLVTETAVSMIERWRSVATRTQSLDLVPQMQELMIEITSRALFGTPLSGHGRTLADAITALNAEMGVLTGMRLNVATPFDPGYRQRLGTALRTVDEFVFGLINDRRRARRKPDDLLSLLLTAKPKETGLPLTDIQVRDEVATMLLAGSVTTANTLAMTMYYLARHPAIQRRVQDEVDHVLGNRLPGTDDIPALTTVRMVLEESMRLWPPVWMHVRELVSDDEIGGYPVAAGTGLLIGTYVTHRLPELWPQPSRFDPERFRPERCAERPRYAYYPFGGGPHRCIGEPMAMMEMVLIIAAIHQCFRVRETPGFELAPNPHVIIQMASGVRVFLEERGTRAGG